MRLEERLAYPPEELDAPGFRLTIGGKARGLLALRAVGVDVPPWRVIPAERAAGKPWETDPEARAALDVCFRELNGPEFDGLAVRSSADLEDSAHVSFAGLFKTVFAEAVTDVPYGIERVLKSAESRLVTGYRGGSVYSRKPFMAILLQARVDARLSGVLFSAHPAQAVPSEACLEVVLGQGAKLASGNATPSYFSIGLDKRNIVSVTKGPHGPETIEPEFLDQLLAPLYALERHFGAPVDIEWAYDGVTLWFLQARPITSLRAHERLRPGVCATSWFFDQRFGEPIHPLTRTTLLPLIARVGQEDALRMRGKSVPNPLIHFYGGQAYVSHEVYRIMFSGVPSFALPADLRQLFPKFCCCPKRRWGRGSFIRYAWHAALAVCVNWWDVFFNLRSWWRFRDRLPAALDRIGEEDLDNEAAWTDRWNRLDRLTERFLQIHRWSFLWANYSYRIFRMIRACLPRNAAHNLENQLDADTVLLTTRANASLARLLGSPQGRRDLLRPFIEEFGHRSPSIDYAAPTWGELAEQGKLDHVYAPLRGAIVPAPPPPSRRRKLLSWLLFPVRRLLEMREEQRFEWERILARQRAMIVHAAHALVERGLLAEADDVWFLEWRELLDALFREVPFSSSMLELRRHEHVINSRLETPLFIGPVDRPLPEGSLTTLRGVGASAGIVQGRTLALRNPSEVPAALEGNTIAVLRSLDPAWTVLLSRVQGLIIERGGLLSHAAILAREYNIPLVIGIEHAYELLSTGTAVTVDGSRGTVHVGI